MLQIWETVTVLSGFYFTSSYLKILPYNLRTFTLIFYSVVAFLQLLFSHSNFLFFLLFYVSIHSSYIISIEKKGGARFVKLKKKIFFRNPSGSVCHLRSCEITKMEAREGFIPTPAAEEEVGLKLFQPDLLRLGMTPTSGQFGGGGLRWRAGHHSSSPALLTCRISPKWNDRAWLAVLRSGTLPS